MKVRSHLIGLVVAAVLPVLVFALVLVGLFAREQRDAVEMGLRGTTRALSAALDERLGSVITRLNMLAVVEDFGEGSLAGVHRRASRVVASDEGWQSISLSRASGEQLLTTLSPYGSPLPSLRDRPQHRRVVETGQPQVSNLLVGKLSGRPSVFVSVPVRRGGEVAYVLTGTLELGSLSRLLGAQQLPEDWTAAILDGEATILARSRASEQYVGRPATAVLAGRIRQQAEDVFTDVTQEGQPAYGAFSRSALTGWTVVLGLPASSLQAPARRTLWMVLGGGAALLALGVGLALVLGQRLARPILALSASAGALGRGQPLSQVGTSVSEVAQVARALEAAGHARGQAEATLREANETNAALYRQAREAVRLRDDFLSVASHELKTPLTTLRLQLELQLRKLRASPESLRADALASVFERMLGQLERLSRLMDELLDVSRLSAGRLELHPEPVDLEALLREVAAHFESEAERSGSALVLQVPAPVVGMWDRSRLEQVLTNLVSNALKYGGGKPVELGVEAQGDWMLLTVKDRGIGIRPEDRERIFERFERAVSVRNYGGLGLGLWITRELVERMGGRISVESTPGEGSCFTVRLPRGVRPS